ncbi:MAG: hypothetical protein ACREI7_13370, partial [Myxococcota bacterium]
AYPTPRAGCWEARLDAPFREALAEADPKPCVFAIPGNHDWYDGLRSFTNRFCYPNRLAAWETKQRRSYFAVALPGEWWLLGIDTQLGAAFDGEQIVFFSALRDAMPGDARVILCLPEPDWLERTPRARQTGESPSQQIERLIGREIDVAIAGDIHHYQRQVTIPGAASRRPLQRITAGGGGAYMVATDKPLPRVLRNRLERVASYPPAPTSKRYHKRLLAFPLLNPSFGLIPALLYPVLGLSALAALQLPPMLPASPDQFAEAIKDWAWFALPLLLVAAVILPFCERGSGVSRALAAGHLAAHVGLVVALSFFAQRLLAERSSWWAIAVLAAGGWIGGSALVGLY